MIIQSKTGYVFDVEVLRNCFTCTILDTETEEEIEFEISERKCENKEFVTYLLERELTGIFIGYNNRHYDNVIVNYIIMALNTSKYTWREMTQSIYNLSKTVINDKDRKNAHLYNKYKFSTILSTIDLATMRFSRKLMAALKALQITMHYDNVKEMVIDWDAPITSSRIPELLSYNRNDVRSTYRLLQLSEENLRIREGIEKEYSIDCLSRDDVATGVDILEKRLIAVTGKKPEVVDYPNPIPMTDVIFNKIYFESEVMKDLLTKLKNYTHLPWMGKSGAFTHTFVYEEMLYSFGIGGLHSKNESVIISPKKNEKLREADAQSLYPIMIIKNGCGPRHLGEAFLTTYQNILDERLIAKKNKWKQIDITLKFALNGVTGNMDNPYSWLYDPQQVLKIRINGQLLFLMLIERLTKIGCTVVSANTDGVTAIIPDHLEELYFQTCREWEEFSSLTLEYDDYEKIIYKDVNSFIAVGDGFTKNYNEYLQTMPIEKAQNKAFQQFVNTTGYFTPNVFLGKGLNVPRIVPKALINYFLFHIKIEDTILKENDFKLFIMSQKPSPKYTVRYGDELNIQLYNRFYISQKGRILGKYEEHPDNYERIITQPVILVNDFSEVPGEIDKMNIYYPHYLKMCRDLIYEIDSPQLTLF